MARRCQKGIPCSSSTPPTRIPQPPRSLVERKLTATRETVLDPVPVPDLALTQLPAEQHRLAAAQRRKVDQALVDVLDLGAVPGDLVDHPGELARLGLDLL